MGVTASGPPYWGDQPLCKCGWMYASQCDLSEKGCGLKNGMPEYEQSLHTPYEFLSESAKEAAVNVVRDMIENSKSTQVGGTHYEVMPLQPWEVFRKTNTPEGYCTYHINTVMAYLMRHDKKGGLTDIKKAADHLRELIRYFEEEQEYPF